jgi:pyridoxal phosphate enzyme (YggS family)
MSIAKKLSEFQEKLQSAKLVVVTKRRSSEEIQEVIKAGMKDIAESRIQEIEEKYDSALLENIQKEKVRLHFIGQIQSNKIKKIVQYCDVIQSLSSVEHAKKIQAAAESLDKQIDVFIQLNLTGEDQKQGFNLSEDHHELFEMFSKIQDLASINIKGFMCMGRVDDPQKTREAFKTCKALTDAFNLSEVSMGMSGDYQIALEEGSTMLRIGSALFERSSHED